MKHSDLSQVKPSQMTTEQIIALIGKLMKALEEIGRDDRKG